MVKIQGPSESERLDKLMTDACAKHGYRLDVEGWARKTYDVYRGNPRGNQSRLVARVESFATTNGEVRIYDPAAGPFAQDVAAALEREFGVAEAVVIQETRPT
jgi:hypothetical protein